MNQLKTLITFILIIYFILLLIEYMIFPFISSYVIRRAKRKRDRENKNNSNISNKYGHE